jgi:hypothetical protein
VCRNQSYTCLVYVSPLVRRDAWRKRHYQNPRGCACGVSDAATFRIAVGSRATWKLSAIADRVSRFDVLARNGLCVKLHI